MARYVSRQGEVEKERTQAGSDNQYVNLVVQSFEVSRDHFSPWYQRAGKWYHLYRGYKQGRRIPYRNNLTIPALFSMIQSHAARIANLSLTEPIPLTFIAVGPEDQVIARKRTALIGQQLEDMDFFNTAVRANVGAGIYGKALYKWTWSVERELVFFRADLGAGEQEYSGEEVTFDGPRAVYTRIRDTFPQPGQPKIEQMRWFIERFFLDLEDVNRLADAGFYLKRGAEALTADPTKPQSKNDETLVGGENPASQRLEGDWYTTDFEKPIEILQMWGRAPRAMNVDGQVNLRITVANRKHLLGAVPNQWGRIPFEEDGYLPDPDYWHWPSMVETCEKLQVASNAMASQKLDALQLAVDSPFAYNARILPNPRKLWVRPGAFLRFEGPVDDSNLRPMPFDLRGLANTYQELEQQMRWMEQGTGVIRDALMGFEGPDRETAHGFVGRQNAANVRVRLAARLFERNVIEKLAMRMVMMNRRFLEFPQQVRMIGTAAAFDPLTMRPIPDETTTMTVNEMLPDYTARAYGAMRGMNQDANFQKLLAVAQLASTNPMGIQLLNWILTFRQLLMDSGVPNPDELMGTDNVVQQAYQQTVAMAMAGKGAPGGVQAPETANVLPLFSGTGAA